MSRRLAGQRILVTGAAGFVGAHTVRQLLDDGAQVHALVHPGSELSRIVELRPQIHVHEADLLVRGSATKALAGVSLDAVCHCAGVLATPQRPIPLRKGVAAESAMALNLVEAVQQTNWQRLVCVTSSYEYGPKRRAHRETDPVAPASARGLSKAVASLILQSLARMSQREFVRLRLFSVYGPWQQESRFVPQAIHAALSGAALRLTAQPTFRDLVFVTDTADAIARAIVAPRAADRTFNVGSGRMITNHAVLREIERLAQRPVRVADTTHPFTEADLGPWVADITRAREVLGWRPRHSLRQGLRLTLDWFRRHRGGVN